MVQVSQALLKSQGQIFPFTTYLVYLVPLQTRLPSYKLGIERLKVFTNIPIKLC